MDLSKEMVARANIEFLIQNEWDSQQVYTDHDGRIYSFKNNRSVEGHPPGFKLKPLQAIIEQTIWFVNENEKLLQEDSFSISYNDLLNKLHVYQQPNIPERYQAITAQGMEILTHQPVIERLQTKEEFQQLFDIQQEKLETILKLFFTNGEVHWVSENPKERFEGELEIKKAIHALGQLAEKCEDLKVREITSAAK